LAQAVITPPDTSAQTDPVAQASTTIAAMPVTCAGNRSSSGDAAQQKVALRRVDPRGIQPRDQQRQTRHRQAGRSASGAS
jgi:hypothetical protein